MQDESPVRLGVTIISQSPPATAPSAVPHVRAPNAPGSVATDGGYGTVRPISGTVQAPPIPIKTPAFGQGINAEDLQKSVSYLVIRDTLRGSALWSVIFGIVAMGTGIAGLNDTIINGILVLIGGAMLIEGILMLIAPKPVFAVVDGLLMGVLGTWNVLISLLNLAFADAPGASICFLLLGPFQWYLGAASIWRYVKYRKLPGNPGPEQVKYTTELLNSLNKPRPEDSERIIAFSIGRTPYRGILDGSAALFTNGKEFIAVGRERLHISVESQGDPALKAQIRINEQENPGTIDAASYDRYLCWKPA